MRKPSSRCGTCRCGSATCPTRLTPRGGSPATFQTTASSPPFLRLATEAAGSSSAAGERPRIESMVHGERRAVVAPRLFERSNHPRRGLRGRLEEERCPVHLIDPPRVLANDLRAIDVDHTAHEKLRIDAEFRELAPRPQRKVLAIAALPALETAGMLPDVALVKQLEVGHVLAGLQPVHDVVDARDAHAGLAVEVRGEG